MKKEAVWLWYVVLLIILPGCEIAEGIFKIGVLSGILLVVLLIIGILYIISKTRKNK